MNPNDVTPTGNGHDASRGNQCLPCVEGVHCHWRNRCGCTVCAPRPDIVMRFVHGTTSYSPPPWIDVEWHGMNVRYRRG